MPLTNPTTTIVAHTPGPWRLDVNGDPYNIEVQDSGMLLARFAPMGRAEFEANARLIAAAPDLLVAAKALVADVCSTESGVPMADTLEAIEDAIAKATGEQP